MKKLKISMMVIFTVLFSCVFLMGCPDDTDTDEIKAGELIILQAYGSSDNAAGVSHSFVELYNTTDKAIKLDGISLYYADGTTVGSGQTNTATEDGAWSKISLNGKTIPAKGSFLILGPKQSAAARHQIPENSGDINSDAFTLSNRAFKVALIKSTAELTVQNPFKPDDSGKPVSGYIDMVGAANDYLGRDLIFGFETLPARNSASEAVRRKDLMDTDNNRGPSSAFPDADGDFASIRYSLPSDNGISDEELEVRKPRTSSDGAWEPFPEEEEPGGVEDTVTAGTADSLSGQLLILQAYGSSSDAAGVSHSFVELYNITDAAIDLNGIGLYYADGTSVSSAQAPNAATMDGNWKRISLDDKSIPAKGSFLILSAQQSPTARYQIPVNSGDINDAAFTLSNRAFKVALIRNTKTLTAQNPFDMGSGAKAEGYIDMVGAANEYEGRDLIFGFEGAPARNSASEAVRRVNLTDTDINRGSSSTFPDAAGDFTSIRYAAGSGSISNEELEVRRPRNSSDGAWDPFAAPEEPVVTGGSPKLMILQANSYGNNNGGAAGFSRSLVELYNNTDTAIDLNAGNYYLHIGDATTWTNVIKLTETIPAKSSFLIVDNTPTTSSNTNATPRALLPAADQEAAFVLSNSGFKVALMRNQNSTLSVANPFGEVSLSADYVDMLGAGTGNNTPNAYETASASQSRPQGPRRTSLTDTDDNSADFATVDYRGIQSGNNGMPNDQLYKYWPRNSAAGIWNPITGEPAVHPVVNP